MLWLSWFAIAVATEGPPAEPPSATPAPSPPPLHGEELRIAVLVDRSRSVGADGLQAQVDLLEGLHAALPEASWAVMAVDAAFDWVVSPFEPAPAWPDERALRHGSELGAAIATARTHDPAPTHVIALTDGHLSQVLPPKEPPAGAAPIHVIVLREGAVPHEASDHPLAVLAASGSVWVAERPVELVPHLTEPQPEMPATPVDEDPKPGATVDAAALLAGAIEPVALGCLKKAKHRDRLGPIRVELTRDEFVYLDLSAVPEPYRWCVSNALFELDLPRELRAVAHARHTFDLRAPLVP